MSASLLVLTALSGAPTPQEGAPAEQVRVEWSARPETPYAGQTFELVLTVSVPDALLEERLLQLFPQALDLPIQVDAFEGLERLELGGAGSLDGSTIAVDGQVLRMREVGLVPGERRFELARPARAPRPGTIDAPGPRAHYVVTSGFREDLVRGRVPIDRSEVDVAGDPLALTALAVPETDRPFAFEGAVGAFDLEVDLPTRSAVVGGSIGLEVTVRGSGPLDGDWQPKVAEDAPFDVAGRAALEPAEDGSRRFRVDVSPRNVGIQDTPALELVTFDPTVDPPAFRTVRSNVVPITVRRPSRVEPPSENESLGDDDERRPLLWTSIVAGAIFVLAVASVVSRQRARAAATSVEEEA